MKVDFILFSAYLVFSGLFCSLFSYPLPVSIDNAQLGKNIQRTMTLLSPSTAQHRKTVKVLFYGQSITKQEWTLYLGRYLINRFPNADIVISNRSVGGFSGEYLVKLYEHDIYEFQPDQMVLYVYADGPTMDKIVGDVRKKSTCEVVLLDNHCSGSMSGGPCGVDPSTNVRNGLATRYGIEPGLIRTNWSNYMRANGLTVGSLTADGTHLNLYGSWLMSELVKPYFQYDQTFQSTARTDLVLDYTIGTHVTFSGNELVVPFSGNRIDLIADPAVIGDAAALEVYIDNQRPAAGNHQQGPHCRVCMLTKKQEHCTVWMVERLRRFRKGQKGL